jgi:integrase
MRVRLKGLNSKTKRLADGSERTYWYAWKGGPRLEGKPGTPKFMASYYAAVSSKRKPPQGVVLSILQGFQASDQAFRSKSPRYRADLVRQIKIIEHEFGDFPLSALTDRRTRNRFMEWRDRLALRSRRQADYAWTTLARVLSWALDRGLVEANPCKHGGRLYRGSRVDKIWTDDDEAAFLRAAPDHLHLPLLLALWTGQRQGDILRLPWSAYDGTRIRLRQSKTGTPVAIKVGRPLKTALDAAPRRSPVILLNSQGKPWTADGFRSSWRKACAKAGISGLTFNDLRGTLVTRLALAEATHPEIVTVTGHAVADVLDGHYLHRDPSLGDSAISKLEKRTKTPDRVPDGPECSRLGKEKAQ